jgi:hypothetical protein
MFKRLSNWLQNKPIKKMGFAPQQWESAIADWPAIIAKFIPASAMVF